MLAGVRSAGGPDEGGCGVLPHRATHEKRKKRERKRVRKTGGGVAAFQRAGLPKGRKKKENLLWVGEAVFILLAGP